MGDTFTADDFIKKLHEGALRTPLTCTGLAKSIEGNQEAFLFSTGRLCTQWTKVPAAMVESVEHLGEESCIGVSYSAVRIRFKEPSANNPEAAVFASLLRESADERSSPNSTAATLGAVAAATAAIPSVGPIIAAVLAAVAAVIALIGTIRDEAGGDGTVSAVVAREEELINALRKLLAELEQERRCP